MEFFLKHETPNLFYDTKPDRIPTHLREPRPICTEQGPSIIKSTLDGSFRPSKTATTHPLCHYYSSTRFPPEFPGTKNFSWNHLKRLDGHEHTQQRCHLVPEALRVYLPPPNALPGEPANDQPLPSWTSDVPHKSPSNLRWQKRWWQNTVKNKNCKNHTS